MISKPTMTGHPHCLGALIKTVNEQLEFINPHLQQYIQIKFAMLRPILLTLAISLVSCQLALAPLTQQEYTTLASLTDAPDFTLAGKAYYGKIQSIYDGDTMKIIIKIGDKWQRFDCRLNWIDTPEVASGVVRAFGAEVRDIVRKMVLGRVVRVQAGEFDKYGRALVSILGYTAAGETINISTYEATHGMAKYYYGGTKQQFTQADYDYFIQNFRNTNWPVFIDYPYQATA